MSKGKVVLIGIVLSLLVPIIHVTTLDVSTSYKSSLLPHSQGNVHVVYWYSYTLIDFLRDFAVSMLVYLFIVGIIRFIRSRLYLRNQ